jgi:hypothetical protein
MNRLTAKIAGTALAAAAFTITPAMARPSTLTTRPVAPTPTVRGPAYPGFGLNYGRQQFYTTEGPVRGPGHGGWSDHHGHDGHDGNHHDKRRYRHDDRYGWGYGGDGDGYVESEPAPDQFGYFGSGGKISGTADKTFYHYDRGYPYQWYNGPVREQAYEAAASRSSTGPIVHCDTQSVPSGDKGRRVDVRICRGL